MKTSFRKFAALTVALLSTATLFAAGCIFENHSHSFSNDWSSNALYHWHSATCGHNEQDALAGHTFVSSVTTPPTFESDGVTTYTCSVCAFDYTETIAKLEHNYSSTWSHNTTSHWHACTDEGYTDLKKDESNHSYTESVSGNVKTFSCLCGYSYTEPVTPDTDEHHFSTEWSSDETDHWHACTDTACTVVTDKANHSYTESVSGNVKTFSCLCGYSYTEPVTPDTDEHHFSTEWSSDETDHWHACTDTACTVVTDKANHSYTSTITTPATYENAGLLTYSCICGKSYTEEIPQLEHNYSSTWSHDTTSHWHACTDEGYTDLKKDESNHSYTESVSGNVKTFSCLCGYSYTEPVTPDTDEHNFSTEWGSDETDHWHACTDTDCTVVADKANHSYTSTITTPATYESAGVRTYTCTACERSYTEEIPKLEHAYSTDWSYDTISHWHACTDEGYTNLKGDEAAHTLSNGACTVCDYVATIVSSGITYSQAAFESVAVEWSESNASSSNVTVSYKLSSASTYTSVDKTLIRQLDSQTARVDIVGLKGGGAYDVQIKTSSGETLTSNNMQVKAYDRSGYAHFNYSDGVGAYKDDGTLKTGALIIYVTDANKNDLLSGSFAFSNGKAVDLTSYFDPSVVSTPSIGYLLNNYTNATKYGIQKLCVDFGAVAIRFIGTVNAEDTSDATKSLIKGLTAYSSSGNGGSSGDNGRMARMNNAKNLTLEGIGNDAKINGWGFHFISKSSDDLGKGFEVRNLTFAQYPEDALGMEGNSITNAVERCWIHNNTFLPGYCAKPAESDKAEGDGSCDFKRGRYYTLSYNYFENCHKTNLIGSDDKSLQYNITMHHNQWHNCESRIPLLRQANIHFYNNYVSADVGNSKLNYVTSARANSYMFSEANYFENCKNVVIAQATSGSSVPVGAVKSYNDVLDNCTGTNDAVIATSRMQVIQNTCKYENIDYTSFDTNSTLFYYDSVNKKSNCLLTDATAAKTDVLKYAGVLKRDNDSHVEEETPETNAAKAAAVTALIEQIGTVDATSSQKINAARTAYDGLTATQKLLVENYSTLTAAESAYAEIQSGLLVAEFVEIVNGLPNEIGSENYAAVLNAKAIYDTLTSAQIATIESGVIAKYEAAYQTYLDNLQTQEQYYFFFDGDRQAIENSFLTFKGNVKSSGTVDYSFTENGTTYYPVKMESESKFSITFTLDKSMTLKLKLVNDTLTDLTEKNVKIDGNSVKSENLVVTITLSAGTHTITKGDTTNLQYISLKPAA